MYETQRGEFRYSIERKAGGPGLQKWHWEVRRGPLLAASGVSSRSFAHAETAALEVIFLAEDRGQHTGRLVPEMHGAVYV